ncbi:MAG: hypothetical protein CSA53_02690 [Gammaproteobacteria bacterium]|nr:MAG: hypothetical protein CSA53_02690 [Gammaproteobacteria bacterium]
MWQLVIAKPADNAGLGLCPVRKKVPDFKSAASIADHYRNLTRLPGFCDTALAPGIVAVALDDTAVGFIRNGSDGTQVISVQVVVLDVPA